MTGKIQSIVTRTLWTIKKEHSCDLLLIVFNDKAAERVEFSSSVHI